MMDGGGNTDALHFLVPGQEENECLLVSSALGTLGTLSYQLCTGTCLVLHMSWLGSEGQVTTLGCIDNWWEI